MIHIECDNQDNAAERLHGFPESGAVSGFETTGIARFNGSG